MKIFKSYTFNILLILTITIVMIWFVFKDDYMDIINLLKNIDYKWLIMIITVVLIAQFIGGVIITIISRFSHKKYKIMSGVTNTLVNSFVSGITPSSTGGQIAQVYVFKKQGIKVSDGVSVIWMDFFMSQFAVCILVLILFILRFAYFFTNHSQFFLISVVGYFLNFMVIIALFLVTKYPKVYTFLSHHILNFACKLRIIKDPEASKESLNVHLNRFASEIDKLKKHKKLMLVISILHCIKQLILYSIPYLTFLMLGQEASLSLYIDCLALSAFVSMINSFFPMPGATGGTEITYMLMFSTLFNSASVKTSLLIWRFSTYYFILIIGLIAFIIVKLSKSKNMYED